jgi:hypothetical protein
MAARQEFDDGGGFAMPPNPEHDAFVSPFHRSNIDLYSRIEKFGAAKSPNGQPCGRFDYRRRELTWLVFTELVPAICYFTSIVIVPATTFGRVFVAYPKDTAKPFRSWQKSPQGRIILSPVLANVFGFSFWVIVAALIVSARGHA